MQTGSVLSLWENKEFTSRALGKSGFSILKRQTDRQRHTDRGRSNSGAGRLVLPHQGHVSGPMVGDSRSGNRGGGGGADREAGSREASLGLGSGPHRNPKRLGVGVGAGGGEDESTEGSPYDLK